MGFLAVITQVASTYWLPLCLAALVARLVYNRYRYGLSGIPGPFFASVSHAWLFLHYLRRRGLEEYDLHQKYRSSLLRVGPNTVSVSDAEAVRIIYGWKPVFGKSRLYISQDVTSEDGTVLQNVSSTRSELVHRDLRRPVAHTYSLSTLMEYEPLVDSTSIVLMNQLEKFAETGQVCSFSDWLQMYAFDVVGEITFSKRLGFLEAGKDVDNMMRHTAKAMDWIGIVGQIPTFDEYLRLKGFGYIWRKFRRTGPIMKFTARQIREHNAVADPSRPDFLTRFMRAREKYPEIMTDGRLATYTNTNVSAGSDTTAIALRQILYQLLTHPGAKDRFMAELAAVLRAREENGVGAGLEAGSPSPPVTWTEGQSMTYYQALIKECLRTHPPLGQLIPRVVPEGGTELCGEFLPAGTVIGCNAWVVHRDKNVFGADADEFRPERWLEGGPEGEERRRSMENLSFAFGGGPRVCLGKNIALLEISKMVPELFRRYEVNIVDPSKYKLVPGWLVAQTGLDVTLKRREGGAWWATNVVKC